MQTRDEWKKGYPVKVGVYACKVDGKEKTLAHKYCELNGKHRWMTLQGGDVTASEILWRGRITDASEIK